MKTITQKCLRRAIAVSVGIDHFVCLFVCFSGSIMLQRNTVKTQKQMLYGQK